MTSILVGMIYVAVVAASSFVESNSTNWAPYCPIVSGKIPRLIPDPTDCRSVFVCSQGRPHKYYCPQGQVFHARKQACVYDKMCSIEPAEINAYTSCPDQNGIHAVMFPHPTHCDMFYQCDWGTAYLHKCAQGLHYNPHLKVCDWPYNANCKARFLKMVT